MWLYELRYQADAWDKPRRVVLVVKEREGDLLLDRFSLVTSLSWTVKLRHEVRGITANAARLRAWVS